MKIKFNSRYRKGTKDEYLSFTVLEECDVHQYIIYDSTFDSDGDLSNLLPHMYRFPSQKVKKNALVFLYIHNMGNRKPIDKKSDGTDVYRFSWGLDPQVNVFNKDGDIIHVAEVNATRTKVIDK